MKEKKLKGKEYNENGDLIFEGEYLEGIKKGFMREYFSNGLLKFEGQIINGLKNEKGTEFNENGEMLFEGRYINGIKWSGKIREYHEKGKLKF